jgi:hypothetical protein
MPTQGTEILPRLARALSIMISLNLQHLQRFFYANLFLCVVMLSLTGVVHKIFYESTITDQGLAYLLGLFALSHENSVATWFSSILLFCTGMAALLCYWSTKAKPQSASLFSHGWIFIAGLFFLMSFDEMGSLHENIGKLDLPEYVVVIPGFLVIVYMAIFAWLFLRKHIMTVALLALGFMLFGSIPIQEHFEIKMWAAANYADTWQRPIRLILLEEGSELFASLCFFGAMISYLFNLHRGERVIKFSGSARHIIAVVTLSCLCVGAICAVTNYYHADLNSDNGIAINWMPSAILMLLALSETSSGQKPNGIVFTIFICISCYFGSNLYSILPWNEIVVTRLLISVLLVASVIYVVYIKFTRKADLISLIAISAWAISVLASLLYQDGFVPALVCATSAFVFCCDIMGRAASERELKLTAHIVKDHRLEK